MAKTQNLRVPVILFKEFLIPSPEGIIREDHHHQQRIVHVWTAVALCTSLLQWSRSCAILSASTIVSPLISFTLSLNLVFGLPLPLFRITIPVNSLLSRPLLLNIWPIKVREDRVEILLTPLGAMKLYLLRTEQYLSDCSYFFTG